MRLDFRRDLAPYAPAGCWGEVDRACPDSATKGEGTMIRKLLVLGLLSAFCWSSACSGERASASTATGDSAVTATGGVSTARATGEREGRDQPGKGRPGNIDWLEIKRVSPAYGGTSFGNAGTYNVIVAVAHGKLDPRHPANSGI